MPAMANASVSDDPDEAKMSKWLQGFSMTDEMYLAHLLCGTKHSEVGDKRASADVLLQVCPLMQPAAAATRACHRSAVVLVPGTLRWRCVASRSKTAWTLAQEPLSATFTATPTPHCRARACLASDRIGTPHCAQAFLGPCKGWRWRYMLLRTYTVKLCEHFVEHQDAIIGADTDALRVIASDTKRPVVERVRAQYAYAACLWSLGRRDGVAKANTRVLELAQLATQAHRAGRMPQYAGTNSRWVTVGLLIDSDVEEMKEHMQLQAKVNDSSKAGPKGKWFVIEGGVKWPLVCHTAAEEAEHLNKLSNAALDRDAACAQCGVAPARGAKLQRCAKCRLASYCSAQCQCADWKAHRLQCRAPGEHREGDIVKLHKLRQRPHLNGQLFIVRTADPNKAGRWIVAHEGWLDCGELSVRQDCMRRVLTH